MVLEKNNIQETIHGYTDINKALEYCNQRNLQIIYADTEIFIVTQKEERIRDW
jgi:hypothetical protein